MGVTHGGGIFAAAEQRGVAWQQMLDFSASINPLGCSPRVKEAILNALDRVPHYPPIQAEHLRIRLASEWGVAVEQILTGNGAADLLRDFCMLTGTGHLAVPVFSEFERLWPNAVVCKVDDPSTWPSQGTLVVTRPVNPTGYLLDADVIARYLDRSQATVLVDESFLDFTQAQSLFGMTEKNPRLVILRSLTKFYALPGLRVGALVGHPDMIARLAQLRTPWSVNVLAGEAAMAALEDREHCAATLAFVNSERAFLAGQLAEFVDGRVWPPTANYIYVAIPYASRLVAFAALHGILLRDCTGWRGCPPSGVRIAIRRRWENERLLAVWKEFLCDT